MLPQIKVLLLILFLILSFIPFLLVTLICIIYRTLVLMILKLKFGSKFGSILSGSHALFSTEICSRCIINVMMIVKSGTDFDQFSHKIKERVHSNVFQNPSETKLLSTRHKFYGYHYFVKNQVEIDKCVRSVNFNQDGEEISKKELLRGISSYAKRKLPYNNTGFWECLLCDKPVRWNNRQDKTEKSYAILVRIHHSLADGLTLVRFMLNTISDPNEEFKTQTLSSQNCSPYNLWEKIRDVCFSILMFTITPAFLLVLKFIRPEENSPKLNGQRILIVKIEESRECLKIIKEIKQKVENTSFEDVLVTAISKSLSNYFQKTGQHPNLTSFKSNLTLLLKRSHLTEVKSSRFINKFSQGRVDIPIIYNTSGEPVSYWKSFMETLEKVKIETNRMKTSNNSKVIYGVLQLLAYFVPEPIISRMLNPPYLPLAITNIPGTSAPVHVKDMPVEDVMYWIPWVDPIGIALGIYSYDQRLQIGLNVDQAIMNEDDAQDFVDGICQALIQLDSKI